MQLKQFSWEIAAVGFVLTLLSIVILGIQVDKPSHNPKENPFANDFKDFDGTVDIRGDDQGNTKMVVFSNTDGQQIKIDISGLKDLERLESLKELEHLHGLQKLEVLGQGLDDVIRELEKEHVNVEVEVQQALREAQEALRAQKAETPVIIESSNENGAIIVRTPNSNVKTKSESASSFSWNSKNTDSDKGAIISTFSADKAKLVEISTDRGHINLTGYDGQQVLMKVKASKPNMSEEDIYQHFDVMNITSDDKIVLRIKKKDSGWMDGSDFGLVISAQIPRGKNVVVHTAGGHITSEGVDAVLDLKTNGGHITIKGNHGPVKAITSGGHLNCDNIDGNAELITKGGHINVENCKGKLLAHTYGGHVNLTRVKGKIDAKTNGGNVNATLVAFNQDASFETYAGQVDVKLPSNFSGLLDVQGSKVGLSGASSFQGEKSSRVIEGYVGNRNHKLVARSSIGTVNIAVH